MKGPDGLCTDCGCTHDLWHAEDPTEWEYREGCLCYLCQEQERKMSRDKQFEGFAKSVVEELTSLELEYMGVTIDNLSTMSRYYREEWEKIIARRAYDLVAHTVDSIKGRVDQYSAYIILADDAEQIVRNIPDMTELPKEQE